MCPPVFIQGTGLTKPGSRGGVGFWAPEGLGKLGVERQEESAEKIGYIPAGRIQVGQWNCREPLAVS